MKRIDYLFVLIAVLYGSLGMVFGIWMGITESLNYVNTHAHIGLVGFVIFALFGLVYRGWPELKETRLAGAHFWLANIAAPVFLYGKFTVDSGGSPMLVAVGSFIVVAAMLAFLANILVAGRETRTAVPPFGAAAE